MSCIHWLHWFIMEEVGLRIRVQRDLRDQFMTTCHAQDTPAAQAIRELMRQYVALHDAVQPRDAEDTKTSPPRRGLGKKNISNCS